MSLRYRNSDKHVERFWQEHDRDSARCEDCGALDVSLQVHHIDGNVGNGSLSNLVPLCNECHKARHENLDTSEPLVEGWKRGFREELFE